MVWATDVLHRFIHPAATAKFMRTQFRIPVLVAVDMTESIAVGIHDVAGAAGLLDTVPKLKQE